MSETEIVVGETVKKRKRPKMPPKETVLPLLLSEHGKTPEGRSQALRARLRRDLS